MSECPHRDLCNEAGECLEYCAIPTCARCGQVIDPGVCGCGETIDGSLHDGHTPVPMGCDCYRASSHGVCTSEPKA